MTKAIQGAAERIPSMKRQVERLGAATHLKTHIGCAKQSKQTIFYG